MFKVFIKFAIVCVKVTLGEILMHISCFGFARTYIFYKSDL